QVRCREVASMGLLLVAPITPGGYFEEDSYAVEVRLNDYLDIICPHYEDSSVAPHSMERYTLYLVEQEEYETCKPRSKEQIRWECNKPDALHGPERFLEKFQRYTPFTLGKEFREGHEYYYISKPIHHHGESCTFPLLFRREKCLWTLRSSSEALVAVPLCPSLSVETVGEGMEESPMARLFLGPSAIYPTHHLNSFQKKRPQTVSY
uniref:Ephrin-A1 n=1 Tax=Podarcis muralis TaxID=64176 RepID=A0A670HQ73_PODMU